MIMTEADKRTITLTTIGITTTIRADNITITIEILTIITSFHSIIQLSS